MVAVIPGQKGSNPWSSEGGVIFLVKKRIFFFKLPPSELPPSGTYQSIYLPLLVCMWPTSSSPRVTYLSGVISLTGNTIQVKVGLLENKGLKWLGDGHQEGSWGQPSEGSVALRQQPATLGPYCVAPFDAALSLLDGCSLWGGSSHHTAKSEDEGLLGELLKNESYINDSHIDGVTGVKASSKKY